MQRVDAEAARRPVRAAGRAAADDDRLPPPGGEAIAAEITIDDFAKVDLRIARIVACEKVEGSTKLLRLTLDVGEGTHAHRLQRHPVGLHARAAGRQAHRDGRQPGAAQDEVRRQRRHGAGRLACRREGRTRASTCSNPGPAPCRACGCAERGGRPASPPFATYADTRRGATTARRATSRPSSRAARVLRFPHLRVRARRRRAALPRPALGRRQGQEHLAALAVAASCAAPPARPTTWPRCAR